MRGGTGLRRLLHSGSSLLRVLALVLSKSLCSALGPPVDDVLAVLVHLQLHDHHLAGVDTDIDGGAVGLLPLDPLDVDPELAPVALDNLAALLSLEVTADHLDLVVLADGHAAHSVLGTHL